MKRFLLSPPPHPHLPTLLLLSHVSPFMSDGSLCSHLASRSSVFLTPPPTQVDYRTEDGTANAGSDYEFAEGTLVFKPGETVKGTAADQRTKTGREERER